MQRRPFKSLSELSYLKSEKAGFLPGYDRDISPIQLWLIAVIYKHTSNNVCSGVLAGSFSIQLV